VDAWRAAYAGIVPDDYLEGLSYEESERRWREVIAEGEGCAFVAEGDQGIFGFASGRRRRSSSSPPTRAPAQASGSWARSPGISRGTA
jgi:hypothetical protein